MTVISSFWGVAQKLDWVVPFKRRFPDYDKLHTKLGVTTKKPS